MGNQLQYIIYNTLISPLECLSASQDCYKSLRKIKQCLKTAGGRGEHLTVL